MLVQQMPDWLFEPQLRFTTNSPGVSIAGTVSVPVAAPPEANFLKSFGLNNPFVIDAIILLAIELLPD